MHFCWLKINFQLRAIAQVQYCNIAVGYRFFRQQLVFNSS